MRMIVHNQSAWRFSVEYLILSYIDSAIDNARDQPGAMEIWQPDAAAIFGKDGSNEMFWLNDTEKPLLGVTITAVKNEHLSNDVAG